MILNNAPVNEAVISNVGQIGEFRIRNSAKAFSILSSGLYANKIRAIIRELSCNAYDSHIAAGKKDTPFDVHLPNSLEPWFSVRDYGVGLSHDAVINIYTTYFESTKTDSNDFVGALGLGSKSPFSYTDNFSVVAVQAGRKGVYTAFINENGVPSIALMTEEKTTDPNGVEVKFSVNDQKDYFKFRNEAVEVYRFFTLRPVVSGYSEFKFSDPEYADKDIIKGVHSGGGYSSIAVMGNIAYPIQVPDSDKSLGDLGKMLNCGLVIEFSIGELDFQPSREGLGYTQVTMQNIKNKLSQLNDQLVIHIATEANKIECLWERAHFLVQKYNSHLWRNAIQKYGADTNFPLFNHDNLKAGYHHITETLSFDNTNLASKYNICIKSFKKDNHSDKCHTIRQATRFDKPMDGYIECWNINVSPNIYFVFNDTTVGAQERTKYHWRNSKNTTSNTDQVFIIEAVNKKQPIKKAMFLADIMNPPSKQVLNASQLLFKNRTSSVGRNVAILRLEERGHRWRNKKVVWASVGSVNQFDKNKTYYYLPMIGFKTQGVVEDAKVLRDMLAKANIYTDTIYGVRKTDLEAIRAQSNWINLDDMVVDKLSSITNDYVMGLVKRAIDRRSHFKYNVLNKISKDSPYYKLVNQFKNVQPVSDSVREGLEYLCSTYKVNWSTLGNPKALIDQYTKEVDCNRKRYPLIEHVSEYAYNSTEGIAEYINLIDQVKKI